MLTNPVVRKLWEITKFFIESIGYGLLAFAICVSIAMLFTPEKPLRYRDKVDTECGKGVIIDGPFPAYHILINGKCGAICLPESKINPNLEASAS